MVLIGNNNNSLTIETFHKNRCIEKREIKDILIKKKYEKHEEEQKKAIEEYGKTVGDKLMDERKEKKASPYVPDAASQRLCNLFTNTK